MTIKFDIHDILHQLSIKRPIFHSEADFQFSLAWMIKEQYPNCDISVNDTLRMYKNDDIRMYNFNCITDTIVEVITTCNTYTLLTVHLL